MIKDKTILISGGLGALSKDLVDSLHENNKLVLVDVLDNPSLDKGIIYIKQDIARGEKLSVSLKVLADKKVKLDGIVNTAAFPSKTLFADMDYDLMKKVVNTKLLGTANVIRSTIPYLNEGASIVNISSVHAHATSEGFSMYSAANAGVISLTKALSIEFKKKYRVNVVTPGGFLTPIYKKQQPDWRGKLEKGQILKIRDITNVIMFLLSKMSMGINGTEIVADVGTSAMRAKSKDW